METTTSARPVAMAARSASPSTSTSAPPTSSSSASRISSRRSSTAASSLPSPSVSRRADHRRPRARSLPAHRGGPAARPPPGAPRLRPRPCREPLSKNAMGSWYPRSGLPFLLPPPPALDTRSSLRHWTNSTTPPSTGHLHLAQQLKARGFSSSLVFFDTTNFSTEQQPRPGDRSGGSPGRDHAKDGNRQASWWTRHRHQRGTSPDLPPGVSGEREQRPTPVLRGKLKLDMVTSWCSLERKGGRAPLRHRQGDELRGGVDRSFVTRRLQFAGSLKRSQVAKLTPSAPGQVLEHLHHGEREDHPHLPQRAGTVMGAKGVAGDGRQSGRPSCSRRSMTRAPRNASWWTRPRSLSRRHDSDIWGDRPRWPGPRHDDLGSNPGEVGEGVWVPRGHLPSTMHQLPGWLCGCGSRRRPRRRRGPGLAAWRSSWNSGGVER